MRNIIYRVCFGLVFLAQPLWASLTYEDLNPTWPEGKPRPTVVLDVDNSLCRPIKVPAEKIITAVEAVYADSPHSLLIPYFDSNNGTKQDWYLHTFFPDVPEMIITLLQWGWNVHFFSAAVERRNEKVLPVFLKEALRPYFKDPNEALEALMQDRISIFSRGHLRDSRASLGLRKAEDAEAKYHKDLEHIGLNVDHTILVDDNLSYAPHQAQEPILGLSVTCAKLYEKRVLHKKPMDGMGHDARKNGVYIVGILSECRTKMLEKGLNLREALREVLHVSEPLRHSPTELWLRTWPEDGLQLKDLERYHNAVIDGAIENGKNVLLNLLKTRSVESRRGHTVFHFYNLLHEMYQMDVSVLKTIPQQQNLEEHHASRYWSVLDLLEVDKDIPLQPMLMMSTVFVVGCVAIFYL